MKWVLLGVVVLLVALFVVGMAWPTDDDDETAMRDRLLALMSSPVDEGRLGSGCDPLVTVCRIAKGDGYARATLVGNKACKKKRVRFAPSDGSTAYDVRLDAKPKDVYVSEAGATLTLKPPAGTCQIRINP
ncbi:MAG: hypothetical protein RMA76_43615 [Deltaproteobacteria bacterium]